MSTSPPVVEWRNVTLDEGETRILNGVSGRLSGKGVVGLIGPRGSGKSSLLLLLAGMDRPTGGSIRVLGLPPGDRRLKGRVAFMPQNMALAKGMPLRRQLMLLAELHGFAKPRACDEANRLLARMALRNEGEKSPEALSHGMWARVACAQAFLGEPELVLLDEPLTGASPTTSVLLRNLIREHSLHSTILLTGNRPGEIEPLCRDALYMRRGELVDRHKVTGPGDAESFAG